ncbi:MAG TPA: nickel pincer cofactor biosynthesis protein LarC [Chloroflexota bacterium]
MIAYLDCYSGISGDMTLGALLDAGLPLDELRAAVGRLPVRDYALAAERIVSKGISGTRVTVRVDEAAQPQRHLADVLAIIEAADLPAAVGQRAGEVFRRLAEAEARIHGQPLESVHFHEVGGVDAIVDVVGAVWGLDRLGVERVYVSALPTGGGKVRSAHGQIPIPAPATLELARRAAAPLVPSTVDAELVTPTGAALATTLGEFRQPPMRVSAVGYGFGRKELPWANALRLWVGEPTEAAGQQDEVSLIETNLDDSTPELLGAAMDRLLGAGALDVFFTPIQMKKNRPATKLSAICSLEREQPIAGLILAETSSLGVRVQRLRRYKADRWVSYVPTPWGRLAIKVKSFRGQVSVAPEYDDCLRVAREHGVAAAEVYRVARAAAAEADLRPRVEEYPRDAEHEGRDAEADARQ